MYGIMQKGIFSLATAVLAVGLAIPAAQADVVVTATQVGGNVVISGGGTLDITGLTFYQSEISPAGVNPVEAAVAVGPASYTTNDLYTGLTGPSNFGSGTGILASSGSGDSFGINGKRTYVAVPSGYTNGSALSATDTYTGKTFATLGMTPGTYVWTLPSTDTFTLQIGPASAAVPTPAAFSAGLALIAGMGITRFRRSSSRSR